MPPLHETLQPNAKVKVMLPGGEVVEGEVIKADFSSIKQSADFTIYTDDGTEYTAVMTGEDAAAGTPPKAITASKEMLPLHMGHGDSVDAIGYVTGLKEVSGSFEMQLTPFGEKYLKELDDDVSFNATDGLATTVDLSQIKADLEELQKKAPPPGPSPLGLVSKGLGKNTIVNSSAQAEALYDNLMKQQLSPAAFAKHYQNQWGPPKKPLKETLLDLVHRIGKELQMASAEELDDFMKQPVAGMYVPIIPPISHAPLTSDPINDPTTITSLHVRLEVTK